MTNSKIKPLVLDVVDTYIWYHKDIKLVKVVEQERYLPGVGYKAWCLYIYDRYAGYIYLRTVLNSKAAAKLSKKIAETYINGTLGAALKVK